MCVQIDFIPVQKNKKMQYQNILIRDSEDGIMTFMMTLDLQHYSSFTDFRNKISQYFRTKRFNLDMRNYLVGGE